MFVTDTDLTDSGFVIIDTHSWCALLVFQLETQLEYAKFQKDVWSTATTFKWKTFRDPSIRRQFKVLSVLGRAALSEDKLKEVYNLSSFTFSILCVSHCDGWSCDAFLDTTAAGGYAGHLQPE